MIFYFTGTGNSKFIAEQVAQNIENQSVKNIADYYDEIINNKSVSIDISQEKYLGIVCPVHSWGLAKSMDRFLKHVKFSGFSKQQVFCIVSCGDNCGTAREQVISLLKKYNNIICNKVYSVQMPNTYIVMKGFGIDDPVLRDQKLKNCGAEITRISEAIVNNTNYQHYVVGSKPFLKGRIIYPLFMKFTMSDKKFYSDENCINCGLCEKLCPEKNIKIENKQPKWLGHCVKCLACIHHCPKQSIQFGDITQDKGRYFFGIEN
ncbi:MAG: EFR1 family ferrodoxin [Bacteroidales bacterium]|nr:EFR1 family ferrodoxin [Bacteroidales bacterium]